MPVLDIPLTIADLADLDLVAAALALQQPLWPPGTRHGYHGITLGCHEGELLRRVEPAGRSLGRFFAEEIAATLGLERRRTAHSATPGRYRSGSRPRD